MSAVTEGYLVLGVRSLDFKRDNEDSRVQMVQVTYCDEQEYGADSKGYRPMTVNVDRMDMFAKFSIVPGYYDLFFRQRAGKGNKPVLVLSDAKFLGSVDLGMITDPPVSDSVRIDAKKRVV